MSDDLEVEAHVITIDAAPIVTEYKVPLYPFNDLPGLSLVDLCGILVLT